MQWEVRWPDGRVVSVGPEGLAQGTWRACGPAAYDVVLGDRTVRVVLLEGPDDRGHLRFTVDGVAVAVQAVDARSLLLERMGMSTAAVAQDLEVRAPMPGKVLSVAVAPGAAVAEGDPLLILEAMKMENVLRSPRAGQIASVHAVPGAAVEKGEVLVAYESQTTDV
jgi:biotin carboxyl carrier protein